MPHVAENDDITHNYRPPDPASHALPVLRPRWSGAKRGSQLNLDVKDACHMTKSAVSALPRRRSAGDDARAGLRCREDEDISIL